MNVHRHSTSKYLFSHHIPVFMRSLISLQQRLQLGTFYSVNKSGDRQLPAALAPHRWCSFSVLLPNQLTSTFGSVRPARSTPTYGLITFMWTELEAVLPNFSLLPPYTITDKHGGVCPGWSQHKGCRWVEDDHGEFCGWLVPPHCPNWMVWLTWSYREVEVKS